MEAPTNTIHIKAYSISELARMYGISNKSMNRWLKPHAHHIGKREGRYYTALQVAIIFEKFGPPGTVYQVQPNSNFLSIIFSLFYIFHFTFLYEPEFWQF